MVSEKNKNLVSLVPKPLAEEVATMNAQLIMSRLSFKASQKSVAIRNRYTQKRKAQQQNIQQLQSMLAVNLLNLPTWLEHSKQMIAYSDWINLNQAVKDEVGGRGLRDLVSLGPGEHNPVYTDLLQSFKQNFLVLTPQDEQKIFSYITLFKTLKIKFGVVTFMINYLQPEIQEGWKWAFSQYQWLLENYPAQADKDTKSIDELMSDVVNIYILRMCTQVLKEIVVNKNAKAALDALVAIRFGCTQFKLQKELVYQQVVSWLETRVMSAVKKSPEVAQQT